MPNRVQNEGQPAESQYPITLCTDPSRFRQSAALQITPAQVLRSDQSDIFSPITTSCFGTKPSIGVSPILKPSGNAKNFFVHVTSLAVSGPSCPRHTSLNPDSQTHELKHRGMGVLKEFYGMTCSGSLRIRRRVKGRLVLEYSAACRAVPLHARTCRVAFLDFPLLVEAKSADGRR
jgi:hypothetical protein